jgi:hypothetical protein
MKCALQDAVERIVTVIPGMNGVEAFSVDQVLAEVPAELQPSLQSRDVSLGQVVLLD